MGEIVNEKIKSLKQWIAEADRIVFFGGAGVSTESHIPYFRSTDGLYNQEYAYPPEQILSHTFYRKNPEEFYRFYRNKMIYKDAQPNDAHLTLARLEQAGKLAAIVTQNIDGLHQMAGSQKVLELHGSVHRNYCENCGRFYGLDAVMNTTGIPRCECGGIIKPDVVLYEEGLEEAVIREAIRQISRADLLIVGGTSLTVYPAAGMLDYFNGKHLVLINRDATPKDAMADLCIQEKIGEVLKQCF